MKNIVIVGATSAIAERCARILVNQAMQVLLVGRNAEKLDVIGRDLQVRNQSARVEVLARELTSAESVDEIVKIATQKMGTIDLVLIAQGILPDQQTCQSDLEACRASLDINAISPVLFAEGFANIMLASAGGTIAVIGSVAGDRARKSNYVYGAAKGFVEKYVQGMQHRLADSTVTISIIKPGPTDTPMTSHLKSNGARLADADAVARDIVAGISARKSVIYTPGRWKYIMLIIKAIPFFIFKKINI